MLCSYLSRELLLNSYFVTAHSFICVFVPRCMVLACSIFVTGNDSPREVSLLISGVWLECSENKNGISAVNRAGLF